MKFIGRFGEYTVLTRLLGENIESYPAVKVNQDSYDLTAISKSGRVVRIQVKTTELNNVSTNNTVGELARMFDFLVVVVVEANSVASCYVLTHAEVLAFKGSSKQLGVSRQVNRKFEVKPGLVPYFERWASIRDFEPSQPLPVGAPALP